MLAVMGTQERRAGAALAAGLILIAAVAYFSVRAVREQRQASDWVSHTRDVLETAGRVGMYYEDIPLHSERFALTGAPQELELVKAARAGLERELAALTALTADNAGQQERLARLRRTIDDGYDFNARIVARKKRGQPVGPLIEERRRKPLDYVREVAAEILQAEQRLLVERRARLDSAFRLSRMLFGAACALALAGLLVAFALLLRDIRRRRDSEARLQESRERLRSIIEGSRDLIVAIDTNWRVLEVNGAFNENALTFQGRTLAAGDDFRDLYAREPEVLAWVKKTWSRALAGEEFAADFEGPLGGRTRYFETNLSVVRGRDQRPLGAAMVARDVTARKEAERALQRRSEELARSNLELERFAYLASHDLKEPLRMVVSYTQLLERRYGDKLDEDAGQFIHYAVDGAKRMHSLIDGLLEFSRVGRGAGPGGPVDSGRCLEAALENLRAALEESGARVERAALPVVLGEPLELTRVFQNLVGNALKFRAEGRAPVVKVGAERRGAEWLFSVRDNGIGLAQEDAQRVFGLFQRLHGRGEYPGTGLGLAICKKIVEGRGGRIWLEGRLGEGAAFFFTLPAA